MRNFLMDQVCATLSASKAITPLPERCWLLRAASLTVSFPATLQAITNPVVVKTRLLLAGVGVAVGQGLVLLT